VARGRKKKVDPAPPPEPVLDEPKVEDVPAPPPPEPVQVDKEPEYCMAPGVSFCAGSSVKGPGDTVSRRDFPNTFDEYFEKGFILKR